MTKQLTDQDLDEIAFALLEAAATMRDLVHRAPDAVRALPVLTQARVTWDGYDTAFRRLPRETQERARERLRGTAIEQARHRESNDAPPGKPDAPHRRESGD